MPQGFLNRFGVKEKSTLHENELKMQSMCIIKCMLQNISLNRQNKNYRIQNFLLLLLFYYSFSVGEV